MNVLRPSRHEEDLLLEKQAKFVGDQFCSTEEGMASLCSAFSKFTRGTAKYRDANDQLASAMNDFSSREQINITLKDGLAKLAHSLAVVGDHRDNSTLYLEEQVMSSLMQYAARCKNCSSEIRSITSAKEKEVSKRRQLTRIRQRLPQNVKVIMKAEGELVEASSKVSQLQESLEQYALSFEMSKLTDLKRILHDFLKAELIFHVSALETLSTAFSDVSDINVDTDFNMFKDVLIRPNMAVRLDIVRNACPPGRRVGIPRNPGDSAVSTTSNNVLSTYMRNMTTDTSEKTSVAGATSEVSESVRVYETTSDDESDYNSSVDDDNSSTIHVKPSNDRSHMAC